MSHFIKLLFIILTILYNFYLHSQSIELKEKYKLTNKYFKEKKYKEAIYSNENALQLSINEFGKNHLTTATLYENKGRLLLELNNFSEAEVQFRKVLEIRNILLEDYNPDVAEALDYLALSLRKQNKLNEAISEHNKVLNIMGNIIANNPGQISELSRRSALYRARAYQTKGQLLIREGNYNDAKGNFKIAKKIFERTLGKNKKELDNIITEIKKLNEMGK